MRIAILGYGMEGRSARRFLKKKYPHADIEIRDRKSSPNYLKDLEKFNMIARSPGIPYLLPEIQRAKKRGVAVTSATKLFFEHCPATVIGITGTKGKGTTATMLYRILKSAGKDVRLVGNIGKVALDSVPKLTKKSLVIFELSSFQLQDLDVSPHLAIVLEIAPDHQDHHKSIREYVDAKANIARHQKKKDLVVYLPGNTFSRQIATESKGRKIPAEAAELREIAGANIRAPGTHNLQNAFVAATAARALDVGIEDIARGLRRFKGLPYHIQLEKMVNGVSYYNDSASTNPIATAAALSAISGPNILIAGGVDKNFDYGILKPAMCKSAVCLVILYGANRSKIARQLSGCGVPAVFARDLSAALAAARRNAKPGDAVLFSPASASFDMFKNSKDRGKMFSRLVKNLQR